MESHIYVGDDILNPTYHFSNAAGIDNLISCNVEQHTNIAGEELAIDTLMFAVDSSNLTTIPASEVVPAGTLVRYDYGSKLIGKFYVTKLVRTGKHQWTFECESYVGLLDKTKFYGMYVRKSDGLTFKAAVEHLLFSDGIRIFRPCEYLTTKPDQSFMISEAGDNNTAVTEIRFRYNGLSDWVQSSDMISTNVYLWGTTNINLYPGSGSYSGIRNVFAKITRSNTRTPFSDILTLRFNYGLGSSLSYGNSGLIIGTINPGDYVTININPNTRIITCNGRSYSFVKNTSTEHFAPFALCGTADYEGGYYATRPMRAKMDWFGLSINGTEYNFAANTLLNRVTYYTIRNGNVPFIANGYLDYQGRRTDEYEFMFRDSIPSDAMLPFASPSAIDMEVMESISYINGANDVPVSGMLPAMSKRAALHQLMFACGVSLLKDDSGNWKFARLSSNTTPLNDSEIFETGDISYDTSVKAVHVTGYELFSKTSFSSDERMTLIDNSSADSIQSNPVIYSFSGGAYDHLTNSYSGADASYYFSNYVSAFCLGRVMISGVPLGVNKSTRTLSVNNGYGTKTASIDDCKLVTPYNIDDIGERFVEYYHDLTKIRNAIVLSDQHPGERYQFTGPYGDIVDGYLSHMSLTVHGIVRGECDFVANYTPPLLPTSYSNYVLLRGSGVYTLPSNAVYPIQVVLIGSGNGGASGFAGEDGSAVSAQGGTGNGGAFGLGGNGGDGGRVRIVTIAPTSQRAYSFSCQQGGNGGAASSSHTINNAGNIGNPTLFGAYSSATGDILKNGYFEPLSRRTYAFPGKKGMPGANGGDLTSKEIEGTTWWYWNDGGSVAYGIGGSRSNPINGSNGFKASGACGGGASYTLNGLNATAPTQNGSTITNGNGGDGADGENSGATAYYGCGGDGGDGGGGGGASGTGSPGESSITFIAGAGGKGGKGGAGRDGGEGCIIVYYNTSN